MEIQDVIMLNVDELKLISEEKTMLENQFNIKINCPELVQNDVPINEVFIVSLYGPVSNVEKAKVSIAKSLSSCKEKSSGDEDKDVPLVVLSDSEDDEVMALVTCKAKKRKIKLKNENDLQIICSSIKTNCNNKEIFGQKVPVLKKALNPQPEFIPVCVNVKKKFKRKKKNKEKVTVKTPSRSSSNSSSPVPVSVPKRIVIDPALLRPVAIDASNIARAHGKTSNTFSCKGILLSVDYFLKRKHSSVKAFVPLYTRHRKQSSYVEITDQHLLDQMHKSGNLVFTPTRNVQGKTFSCYDDRFIVEYASATGGVILSNDNYRDLMAENETFKKTVEERLLMYCFVGDMLMIPQDPLGRNGPSLDEFLSFPPSPDQEVPNVQKSVAPATKQNVLSVKQTGSGVEQNTLSLDSSVICLSEL